MAQTRYECLSNIITNLWKYNNYDNTPKLLNNIIFAQFVGIRRDLVSEPRRPDVYLAVNPGAFGSQLDDENERFVFLLIMYLKWRLIESVLTASCDIIDLHLFQS